jgi:hypothetical protein
MLLHGYLGEIVFAEARMGPIEQIFIRSSKRTSSKKFGHRLYFWALARFAVDGE